MTGQLALVGGGEFLPPAREMDAWLLERAGARRVAVLPTAAARERPERAVDTARRHFEALGARVEGVMVVDRAGAEDPAARDRLAAESFIYLTGGDPRHLAAVLRETPAWQGTLDAWAAGSMLAGSSAGAMVLCEHMLLPGASGVEPGLGLLRGLVVVPHHDRWADRVSGMLGALAGVDADVLGIDEATGLVLDGDGGVHVRGAGAVTAYRGGEQLWRKAAPAVVRGWR